MLKLSPTRVKAKRNAHGFNYIQLIVGMIIFVALSRIVGPPAFRMITRARSTALSANIQTAAETVRNVLAIDPAKKGTVVATTGAPSDVFLAALTDAAPFSWESSWTLTDTDDSDTIRVQFIGDGTNGAAAANVAPVVGWQLNAWDAVRIQARNQDGAWACALIVLKPDSEDGDQTGDGVDGDDTVSGSQVAEVDTASPLTSNTATKVHITKQLTDARLRGIWYDSGPSDATVETNCSPAEDPDGGGAKGIEDPIPEAADTWTISTNSDDRVLTRNA